MKPLYSEGNTQYNYPYRHDPQEKKFYTYSYRPLTWTADTEVVQGIDVFIPAASNGFLYECTSGGITGSSEPTWGTVEKGTTADNTAVFTAKPLILILATGDTVTTSTWRATNSALWEATEDVVVGDVRGPTIYADFVFDCTTAGTTDASEPTWPTVEGDTVTDGTAVFTARFAGTIDNTSIVSNIMTKFRLTAVPTDAEEIIITNHVTVTRASGDIEEFERSIIIPITTL